MAASMDDVFAAVPTPEERRTHLAYDALMRALARPGEPYPLPEPGLAVAGECLLDLDVGFFTPDARIARLLVLTGARATTPETADYLFLPRIDPDAIGYAVKARSGDPLYPDRSATLFVGARLGSGQRLRLSGPGVRGQRDLLVDGVDPVFWYERERVRRYPLGWDIFLVDADQVVGLPRSTGMEAGPWPM